MRPFLLSGLCAMLSLSNFGQFYPVADATWCAGNGINGGYRHVLDTNPDTTIAGISYKTVRNYRCLDGCPSLWEASNYELISRCFIRSTPDGKGYIRDEDDTLEYLIGDIGALVGDTVRDVLILGNNWSDWEEGFDRTTYDVIVDSIVDVERWGVTVRRHFIHELSFWNPDDSSPYNFWPWRFYWQQGMGTSHGLILRMELALSDYYGLLCAMSRDTTVFSWYGFTDMTPWGYPPGGPACCAPWDVGIGEHLFNQRFVSENPSTGLFRLNTTAPIAVEVFDAQGRAIAAIRANELDLSAHPPGLYTAVVTTAQGRQAIRLMVVR